MMGEVNTKRTLKHIIPEYTKLLKVIERLKLEKRIHPLHEIRGNLNSINVLMGVIQEKGQEINISTYASLVEISGLIQNILMFYDEQERSISTSLVDRDSIKTMGQTELQAACIIFRDAIQSGITYATRYIIDDLSNKIDNINDIDKHNAIELETLYSEIKNKLEKQYIDQQFKIREMLDKSISNFDSNLENAKSYIHSTASDLNLTQQDSLSNSQRTISDLIKSAKKESDEAIKKVSNIFEQLESESSNRIQVRIQKAENIVANLTTKVDKANQELTELIQDHKKNLTQFSQDNRSSLIDTINDTASNNLTKIQEAQSHALTSLTEQMNREIKSINDRINVEVNKFESKRTDMDNLLEKVGLARDAEVTITQANKEEATADKLRNSGFRLLYASILLLVLFFSEYVGLNFWSDVSKSLSDLTIDAFAIRFMTVILVSSPAIYLLKESAYHRNKENLYRQRGTQLLTIRGYLADLPQEQRADVKHKLAENFFSFHNGKADTQNVPDFLRDMKEAVGIAKSLNGQTKTVSQRFSRKAK